MSCVVVERCVRFSLLFLGRITLANHPTNITPHLSNPPPTHTPTRPVCVIGTPSDFGEDGVPLPLR